MKTKTKYKLFKILTTMMAKIMYCGFWAVLVVALMVLCAPCLLIFSVGEDGEMTIWNFVGLAWLGMLIIAGKKIKW